jgi:hypothetical protein
MAKSRIYIPTFIADADFNPANVQPRLFFWNGMIECDNWVFKQTSENGFSSNIRRLGYFPAFNHYTTGSNGFPDSSSESLLFFNEATPYGERPTETLYSKYWETYIELLYNPRTRLIDAEANIPLADYFDIELNDIIQFRGNYYHLRAINDYNLVTGECKIQLLGPIIEDAMDDILQQAAVSGSIPTK